jgi:short-subunit dehydrogenase
MSEEFRRRYGPWALVAGAAVGLGAEWARQIAARGLGVCLIDRDGAPLEATARAVHDATGSPTRTLVLDLARPDVADAVVAATGDLEVGLVVYNAAIGLVSPFLELSPADVQAMLDVNCRAPLLLARALAPAMVARSRGGIVFMSSMSGSFGSAQLTVYAATKAFDLVFADALWAELRAHGVDVLAVQPGSTRTPGWQSSQPPELQGPGPHVMEPEHVVAEALATLGVEPSIIPGELNRQGAALLAAMPRRQAIELMSGITETLRRVGRRS